MPCGARSPYASDSPAEAHRGLKGRSTAESSRAEARRAASCRDWRVGPFSPEGAFSTEGPLRVLGAGSGLAVASVRPKLPFVSQGNLKLLKPLKVRSACPLLPNVAPAGIRE